MSQLSSITTTDHRKIAKKFCICERKASHLSSILYLILHTRQKSIPKQFSEKQKQDWTTTWPKTETKQELNDVILVNKTSESQNQQQGIFAILVFLAHKFQILFFYFISNR